MVEAVAQSKQSDGIDAVVREWTIAKAWLRADLSSPSRQPPPDTAG